MQSLRLPKVNPSVKMVNLRNSLWELATTFFDVSELAQKALSLLTILATSVPFQRLFSTAGETMAEKQNSLQGK